MPFMLLYTLTPHYLYFLARKRDLKSYARSPRRHRPAQLLIFGRLFRNGEVALGFQTLKKLFTKCIANFVDLIEFAELESAILIDWWTHI